MMMSSSETHPPSSVEASSPTTECPPRLRWKLPNGEWLIVAQTDRLQHHPVSTQGVARVVVANKDPEPYDVIFSVDPGEFNVGVCMLLRDHENPKNLRLELAFQLEYDRDAKVTHVVLGLYKYFCMWMDQWNDYGAPGVLLRLRRALIVVEQQYNGRFGKCNFELLPFVKLMEMAVLVGDATTKHEFKVMSLSPKSVASYLGLPPTDSHPARKAQTKLAVQRGLGAELPRHDMADAIALAITALGKKKGKVTLRPTEILDTSPMFVQPPPEDPGQVIDLKIDYQTGQIVEDDIEAGPVASSSQPWTETPGEGGGQSEGSASPCAIPEDPPFLILSDPFSPPFIEDPPDFFL